MYPTLQHTASKLSDEEETNVDKLFGPITQTKTVERNSGKQFYKKNALLLVTH